MLLYAFASLQCYALAAVAQSVFEVPHVDGADDTLGLISEIAKYTNNSVILFKENLTYNIFTPIKFPSLSNVEVRIEGNLTYPTNITAIQGE